MDEEQEQGLDQVNKQTEYWVAPVTWIWVQRFALVDGSKEVGRNIEYTTQHHPFEVQPNKVLIVQPQVADGGHEWEHVVSSDNDTGHIVSILYLVYAHVLKEDPEDGCDDKVEARGNRMEDHCALLEWLWVDAG